MDADTADTPPPVDTYGTDSDSKSDSNPLRNGLIGGGVGILLSFVPGSTLLGGAVAGYLEGGELENALNVGSIAGVVMFVPLLLLGLVIVGGLGYAGPTSFLALTLALLLGGVLYTVGLSVLGAAIGIVLADEL